MFQEKNELLILIVAGTIIILLLGIFIIGFLFFYQRKHNNHIDEREFLESKFQQEIAKTQFEVQEQTMQTIGADLHDNIGQLLSLTSLTLNSIELENNDKARQKIDASIDLTLRSIKEMRQLGKLLQGDQLVSLGLSEAIRYEINWMERSGKFNVAFVEDGTPNEKNPDKDLILFRIIQETMSNIIRHAAATEINIRLGYIGNQLDLSITDNGVGFDAANLPVDKQGMGLLNIQKRAGIIGGTIDLQSAPGSGTAVTIVIPYP